MEPRQLQIGDKMYNAKQDGFEDFVRYSFSEVVKLTKTLAVLKNGVRLVNRPRTSFLEEIGYCVSQKKRNSLASPYHRCYSQSTDRKSKDFDT